MPDPHKMCQSMASLCWHLNMVLALRSAFKTEASMLASASYHLSKVGLQHTRGTPAREPREVASPGRLSCTAEPTRGIPGTLSKHCSSRCLNKFQQALWYPVCAPSFALCAMLLPSKAVTRAAPPALVR